MSKYHPLSNYYIENKEEIPLTTPRENQPLSTTPQSIMAAPFGTSLRKGSKAPKVYKTAKPTKALNYAEKSMYINDDYSNQFNTNQAKDLAISSPDWETTDWKTEGKGKAKGRGKGKGKRGRRERGKGKEEGKVKATGAYHTYQKQEIDAASTSFTFSKTISDMPTAPQDNKKEPDQHAPYDNKKEPDQPAPHDKMELDQFAPDDNEKEPDKLTTDKTAHEASDHRKKLPTEIWTEIWELVANDNPRNLDIWTWSEGPEKLWENEKQRITHGPQDYSSRVRWHPFKFITTQIVPPILHVSCLSREIGLKYYKLGFGCNLGMPKLPSGDYSILEPRIYCHKNDLICPMGRFSSVESKCFWEHVPKEISAMAFNLGRLKNVPPKLHGDTEDYNNQIIHEHFSYEYPRGLKQHPDRLDELDYSFFGSKAGKEFSKRASKIYVYCFTDYISKRGPRDFRFTPFINDSKGVYADADTEFSFENLMQHATFSARVSDNDDSPDDMYRYWQEWLRYGGLKWLKEGGPKPGWIQMDNPTPYDRERNEFFRDLEPWEEEIFIKRGVPNIGMNSKIWVPGVPEVHPMKLEIHG